MSATSIQLRLGLRKRQTHGGARAGSGPKPKGGRAGVSHHGRPEVTRDTPVHTTLRVLPHVWNLRSRRALHVVEAALAGARAWREFRIVHFSVQGDHLHFIVEADGNRALSEGMQGLTVRLAKGLNRLMATHGKVFAARYHAHVLATPSEVRNALAYVLLNHRSHMARIGAPAPATLDRFSSAATFDGWRGASPMEPPRVTSAPGTWLLRAGWKKRGLISPLERPAAPSDDAEESPALPAGAGSITRSR
jgi:REP element-mobilizing transposase RayT